MFLSAAPAVAQDWQLIQTPYQGTEVAICPYFLNAKYGFTYSSGGQGPFSSNKPNLLRTTDGGQSFLPIVFFDTANLAISQLCFASPRKGYAATYFRTGQRTGMVPIHGGVYETLDSGAHWNLISLDDRPCMSVYAVGDIVFASSFIQSQNPRSGADFWSYSPLLFSTNDGATWDSVTKIAGRTIDVNSRFGWIYGNRDSLLVTVLWQYDVRNIPSSSDGIPTRYVISSTDLGQTWQSSRLDSIVQDFSNGGSTQIFYGGQQAAILIPAHQCSILRQAIDVDIATDLYDFLKSKPPFLTWDTILAHHETSQWISGNACSLYLPVAVEDSRSSDYKYCVLRSIDQGKSWQGVRYNYNYTNPPFEEIDDQGFQNLSVVGYGAVVYGRTNYAAPGNNLVLLKTTTGGDGTLNSAALAPRIILGLAPFANGNDTLFLTDCKSGTMNVYYENTNCAITRMDSISLDGIDTSEYSQSVIHRICGVFGDTIRFELHPGFVGTREITVNAHFTDDEYARIDTSLRFILVVNAGEKVDLDMHLKPSPLATRAGDTIDIPVYLSSSSPSVSLKGTTTMLLPFTVDTKALNVLSFNPSIPSVTAGSLGYVNNRVTVLLLATDLTFTGEVLIGRLRCVVYLSDTLKTSVSLGAINISAEDARCLSLSSGTQVCTISINGCGDSLILATLLREPPFRIESLLPNPARDALTIRIRQRQQGANASEAYRNGIAYEFFDASGRGIFSGQNIPPVLDIRHLTSGLYYLRLSQNGFIETRQVAVHR